MEPAGSSSSSSGLGDAAHFDDAHLNDNEHGHSQPNNSNNMVTIYQYSGNSEWRLPTIDPNCLRVQAYFKFCGIPFVTNNCNNPSMSQSKSLPVVAFDEATTVAEPENIIKYTNKMGYDLDRHLSDDNLADLRAFQALLEDSLDDIHLYHLWVEPENTDAVKVMYSKRLPFPSNWWIPSKMQSNIERRLKVKLPGDGVKIYARAASIYDALSKKLGNNEFFFGNSPTTFDALAFGYLITQLTLELPNMKLKALIASHENLRKFCNNILKKFFDDEPLYINEAPLRKFLAKKAAKPSKAEKDQANEAKDFQRKSAYAIMFGLLSIAIFGLLHNSPTRQLVRKLTGEAILAAQQQQGSDGDDDYDGEEDIPANFNIQ